MDTKPAPMIRVPVCFGGAHSLAYRAYQVAFLKGYELALDYLAKGKKLGDGSFPEAPVEFQGHEFAERAWKCGCADGSVQATRDRMATVDMLEEAAAVMDEIEALEPLTPAETSPAAILAKDREEESKRLQAIVNADFAAAEGEARRGVVSAVVLCGAGFLLIAVVAFIAMYLWF